MESYVTPILLSYVDKYVRDFNPADVQVSLWGGGVTLHNLVLRPDVLQREVALPFTLVSGRIHELLINVPWTKITSEPITVTINTIECVLSLNPPNNGDDGQAPRDQLVPSPPRYMRGLIRRVVSNISFTIQSLIVKYVHDDIVLSLNIKWLYIDSADADWRRAFADIDAEDPVVRRLVRLDDFTLCLDRSDGDGRIRHYQEPLLDRCQLEIRILTTLVSLQNRKAKNLTVEIRSENLELGVTSDQLLLLLRLLRERPPPGPPPRPSNSQPPQTPVPTVAPVPSKKAAPRVETWSEWAWSWLPSWSERGGVGEAPAPARPFPILVTALLDNVAFVYKIMETDAGSGRRHTRPLLELRAGNLIVSYLARAPTLIRLRVGARALQLVSRGKCVCGHYDLHALEDRPTPYIVSENSMRSTFYFSEDMLKPYTVETMLQAEENGEFEFPEFEASDGEDLASENTNESDSEDETRRVYHRSSAAELKSKETLDRIWFQMSPAFYLQIDHDRHTKESVCPYENPPHNFEYSDWKESQRIRMYVRPMTIHACSGLLHRVELMKQLLRDLPPIAEPAVGSRPLTVEECDALTENIPGRCIDVKFRKLQIIFTPWDHQLNEQPAEPLATLDVVIKRVLVEVNGPLYPRRVCQAACEIPEFENPIREASYAQVALSIQGLSARLSTPSTRLDRPILDGTLCFYGSILLHKHLFRERNTLHVIGDVSVPLVTSYTTPPALITTVELLRSLYCGRVSTLLKDTTLADDVNLEKDTVALDCALHKGSVMFTLADNIKMFDISAILIKMTAVELKNGLEGNIGWVMSAPDYERNVTPCVKVRLHLCDDSERSDALEYISVETDSSAVNLDPLLMRWLIYRPHVKPKPKSTLKSGNVKSMSTTKYFNRRRATPPASTARGSRAGSAAEYVHGRTRSAESVSERRDPPRGRPSNTMGVQERLWDGEKLLQLYQRLRRTLIAVDTGALLVYTTSSTASALNTATVHEAMERHATELHRVLVFSLGKWVVTTAAHNLWEYVNDRIPTYLPPRLRLEQSFPWKANITGMSSFTLESSPPTHMTDKDRDLVRNRSQSRTVIDPEPRTLLELLESTVIISIVTKRAESEHPRQPKAKRPPPPTKDDQTKKYFTGGMDYRPTTFSDYVRGPTRRPGSPDPHASRAEPPEPPSEDPRYNDGPLVSLGVHIHADTPPVNINVTQDQIHTIRAAFHTIAHIIALLRRPKTPIPLRRSRVERPSSAPLLRSGADLRSSSEGTPSENISEQLIPIFQTRSAQETVRQLKTLIWFQWVVSRASISFISNDTKLTLQIEDSITTIDLQEAYEQFRFKMSSCSIYHFKESESGYAWVPGVLDGRVLETREGSDGNPILFFNCAVTRAHVSNLPPAWKEEFITKPHRYNQKREGMWELTLRTAPLEVVLHPEVLEAITLVGNTLVLSSFCPVPLEKAAEPVPMPLCHLNLGGVRLIVSAGEYDGVQDDTLIFNIGAIETRPHPENPICRRLISTLGEAGWTPAASAVDGRQHELIIKSVGVRSARIREMLAQMRVMRSRSERTVNPAANWAEPLPSVHITPMLHNVDVVGVFAPPLYNGTALACGPALELNVPADVTVELSAEQVALLARVLPALQRAVTERDSLTPTTLDTPTWCPLSTLYVFDDEQDEDELDETMAGVSDSGIDQPSTAHVDPQNEPKKAFSVSSLNQMTSPWELVEVYMMMGRIDVALYVRDDPHSLVIRSLRPPDVAPAPHERPDVVEEERANVTIVIKTGERSGKEPEPDSVAGSKSLTETVREVDVGRSRLEIFEEVQFARRFPKFIPILHATLSQPNMYYWRKKAIKGLQMSLFNLWVAHGEGQDAAAWHAPLLSTREGEPDPDTEIPPSLVSVHFETVPGTLSEFSRDCWNVVMDVDRPVLIDLQPESLRRLRIITSLVSCALTGDTKLQPLPNSETPFFNLLQSLAVRHGIEQVTVRTCQTSVETEGVAVGWEALAAQLASTRRPARLSARALLTALAATTHAPHEQPRHHVAVQPLTVGAQAEATWEPWRMSDQQTSYKPVVRVSFELSDLAVDVRPGDIAVLEAALHNFSDIIEDVNVEEAFNDRNSSRNRSASSGNGTNGTSSKVPPEYRSSEVYYKDDLRSGAFKIICGEEAHPPMAYECALMGGVVAWRYPAPRSIVRIVAHPLPDCDEEVDCVLESLNLVLDRWETNAFFKIPVSESREYRLSRSNADKVFAYMWRVRLMPSEDEKVPPFEFNRQKYLSENTPYVHFGARAEEEAVCVDAGAGRVSAEHLAGALRVDSYLATHLRPHCHVGVKCGSLTVHAHNDIPPNEPLSYVLPKMSNWEGIYVSNGQRRAHRVLSANVRNALLNLTESNMNKMLSFEGLVGVDIFESETGTMEPLVGDFRLQAVVSKANKLRARVCAGDVRVYLNGPRVRTLTTMITDWKSVFEEFVIHTPHIKYGSPFWATEREMPPEVRQHASQSFRLQRERLETASGALEGRVYLYLVNTCDVPLRLGQEGTDEILTLASNTTLAYRWNSPLAPKKLRFSTMSVSADWHWCNSVPFSEGTHKVRLEEPGEAATGYSRNSGNYLYLRVEDLGGRKKMIISGKVMLGNMLRDKISYKVRVRDPASDEPDGMRMVSRGELAAESVGNTVVDANCAVDTYIKIKFSSQEFGWTGDIPLKPCPKSHVPWLVKVPLTTGEVPCVSVWCRVERTHKDDRVSVIFFPMFLMRSHLPLDVNVSMTTEPMDPEEEAEPTLPLLTQRAIGRGTITQLLAHGTTTVKHTLIFRYRLADCEVTRESVPLHYGMAEKVVFEQYSPPATVEDILADANKLLSCDIGENMWPYSIVRTHWPCPWQAADLQPRCEVLVRYEPVRCGGGGCGMLVHLAPRALLANAAAVAITVRTADAAPLCRIDPGTVIALPAPIVQSPFFITIQERHEVYMSNELCVSRHEPGVYGKLRAGLLGFDRPSYFAVHCNDRVALMTIYYSMYGEINVFGVTSTYLLMNKLPFDILIAPMVIQNTPQKPPILRPDVYTRVKPTLEGIVYGEPITYFWLGGPWSDNVENLRAFLCISMPDIDDETEPAHPGVPVQVGVSAMRRSIALRNDVHESIPVVVTQVLHEGRWLVTVAPDPCPQYLVRNLTREPVALAQPLRTINDPDNEELPVVPECTACKWWAVLEPEQYSYYSTPTHLASGAPTVTDPDSPRAAFLAVGRLLGELTPDWGSPFAVMEGEQLVQMPRQQNLKVRVRVHPHSTAIDLLTVDEGDLSASEIRRRLAHRFTLPDPEYPPLEDRIGSDNRLVDEMEELQKVKLIEGKLSNTMTTEDNSKAKAKSDKSIPSDKLPESEEQAQEPHSTVTLAQLDFDSETSLSLVDAEPNMAGAAPLSDWLRCAVDSVTLELAQSATHTPLVRAAAERVLVMLRTDAKGDHVMVSVGDVQVDNPQHASRQFDFAVVASTSAAPRARARAPPLWGTLAANEHFDGRPRASSIVVRTTHVKWTVAGEGYGGSTQPTELRELRDLDIYLGPISLYIEDVFVRRVSALARLLAPPPPPVASSDHLAAAEALQLYKPLRVHRLYIHPLDLTLTLHTAMRLYIGVDKSPLRMSAFKLENVVTTADRLTHELTVHYLSGAILGAGWVVGGLELLGAPGSLAARLSGARGGVRDVATTAGAAVLRSLNSCAGSLARNLDLLAGDDEHTQRAAIARREIPPTLMAGLFAGMQNFAINILGAVGGLAHHPVVGLAVGEASGAAALRRGLVGALAKPLSATADLVAFAGQGLLAQTGWDPDPQQRPVPRVDSPAAWRRDNVRWAFRLQPLRVLYGVDATLDGATVRLVVTDKFLVVAEPSTERIVEMVDFRFCKLISYDAQDVELCVTQHGPRSDARDNGGEETGFRVNSAAMARVARYTGARAANAGRALRLRAASGAPALAAAVLIAVRQNKPTHFSFL